MTQPQFEAKLAGIPEETFGRMVDASGSAISRSDFMDLAKIEALGGGQYLVKLGRGYLLDSQTKRPFVLDMAK
jgi:hypothetical protein